MKLTNKELAQIWFCLCLSLVIFGTIFEKLHLTKGEGNLKIYNILLVIFYSLICSILMFFYNKNLIFIWFIYILLFSLGSINQIFDDDRLGTYQYITYSFIMLYLVYTYKSYFKKY